MSFAGWAHSRTTSGTLSGRDMTAEIPWGVRRTILSYWATKRLILFGGTAWIPDKDSIRQAAEKWLCSTNNRKNLTSSSGV